LEHFSLSVQHLCHAVKTAVCGPANPKDAMEEEDEEDEAALNARAAGVFLPTDKWKETWDLLVLNMIIYSAISVPYRICFDAPATGMFGSLEQAVSFLFFVDVIFNFNTAYVEGEKWVIDRPAIAVRYLQGWFWIDFPSCIPVSLLDSLMSGDQGNFGMLRFLRLFRLLRLLKLLRLATIVAELEDRFDLNLCFLRIMQMLLALIFLAHILACFWFYMAAVVGIDPEIVTWVSAYRDGYLMEEPPSVQYLASMYWALTTLTTVGYGDIVATNDAERGYAVFALLMGALVFGYMISSIASLVKALDRQGGLTEERMDEIKEYMRWRKLPRELTVRMRRYYENYYDTCTAFDEKAILGNLTPSMRMEVVRHVFKDTLGKLPLFANKLDRKLQVAIFSLFRPVAVMAKEVIFSRGDMPLSMYILLKGGVEAVKTMDSSHLYRVRLRQFFGTAVLTGRRHDSTHRSITKCDLFSIAAEDLRDLFNKFPLEGSVFFEALLRIHRKTQKVRGALLRMFISQMLDTSDGKPINVHYLKDFYVMKLQLCWEKMREAIVYAHMPTCSVGDNAAALVKKTLNQIVAPPLDNALQATHGLTHGHGHGDWLAMIGALRTQDPSGRSPKLLAREESTSPQGTDAPGFTLDGSSSPCRRWKDSISMPSVEAPAQPMPMEHQAGVHASVHACMHATPAHQAGLHASVEDLHRDMKTLIHQVAGLTAKLNFVARPLSASPLPGTKGPTAAHELGNLAFALDDADRVLEHLQSPGLATSAAAAGAIAGTAADTIAGRKSPTPHELDTGGRILLTKGGGNPTPHELDKLRVAARQQPLMPSLHSPRTASPRQFMAQYAVSKLAGSSSASGS